MPSVFDKFAQIGRVVYIEFGPLKGRAAVIVDIVDHNRCIIDGPESVTGVFRMTANFKKIRLTDIVLDIPRGASTAALTEVAQRENLAEKFQQTTAAKNFQKETATKSLSDFDRFKIRQYSLKRNVLVRAEFEKLKEQDKKSNEESYAKLDRAVKIRQRALRVRKESRVPRHFKKGI